MSARDQDGTTSLELVIIAPMLFAVLGLIFACGWYAQTESLVDQAARDATRAATAQNSRAQVRPVAEAVSSQIMASAPRSCAETAQIDDPVLSSGAFEPVPVEDPGVVETVSVTARCTLDLSELSFVPFRPIEITRTFTSPLDRYRGYQ